jgi:hypothetical protein
MVTIGIDTHKATLAVSAIDGTGRETGARTASWPRNPGKPNRTRRHGWSAWTGSVWWTLRT